MNGEPLPQLVTNAADQYHAYDDAEPAETKFSFLASSFEWQAARPKLPPSIEPEVICSITRFNRQYVPGNAKEERLKRTKDGILNFSVVDSPIAAFESIFKNLE